MGAINPLGNKSIIFPRFLRDYNCKISVRTDSTSAPYFSKEGNATFALS
jgi:hypothetical protein